MPRPLAIVLALLAPLAAGCPDAADDTTDHAAECPDLDGSLFARGIDLGDTRYEDGASSMIPGSTQLVTIGRYRDSTLGSDFSEPFDAELLGAAGIDLVRVSKNQFLLRAEREGSACIRLSDPAGDPDDVTTIPLYSVRALRVGARPRGGGGYPGGLVYARGAEATVELSTGGGVRLVDSGLRLLHDGQVSQRAWDTVALYRLGTVPLDVVTSDGATTTVALEVVAQPEQIDVVLPKEMPSALVAGYPVTFCLHGTHRGRSVAGLSWTFAVTNASWTTDNGLGMPSPGCVTVKPAAAGQRVEIAADANGAAKVLAFDVI